MRVGSLLLSILSMLFLDTVTGEKTTNEVTKEKMKKRSGNDIRALIADEYTRDFTFDAKFGFRDYRGGGRSSARETNVRVAAGAVAKKLLAGEFPSVVPFRLYIPFATSWDDATAAPTGFEAAAGFVPPAVPQAGGPDSWGAPAAGSWDPAAPPGPVYGGYGQPGGFN